MKQVGSLPMIALLLLASVPPAGAIVSYEEGMRTVRGVTLLRDAENQSVYHYLPQFPRLSTKEDGTFELLCVKYVDAGGGAHGGLFHALVEFGLPPELLSEVEKELQKDVPGARIAGPVPLKQTVEDGQEAMGSFRVVSSVLSDREEGGFTRSLVTSGSAPLLPGSKAVVAAVLDPKGATLLWDSFTGPTSDVSISIHAYYEALVKGYNARVRAEVSTVYEHFSRIQNFQKEYVRRQSRRIVDELVKNGDIQVEVVDRSAGLGIDAKDMEAVLQLVTDKLVELVFDAEKGWSADPPRETAVEADQIQGRQKRGWFSRVFGGAQDTKYFSDDQYVLKRREDVRRNVFTLNLAKSTTIRVPVDTSGNLGGLYDALSEDLRYFRIVNLEDPAFELRRVHFQVDGNFLDSFQDAINLVSVNVRKRYPDAPAFTRSLLFTYEDVQAGKTIQEIAFPRLGMSGPDWTEYEYQVRWSLREGPTISVPAREDQWIASQDAAVSLTPPFRKRVVEVDADRELFSLENVSTAVVEFATVLGGEPKAGRRLTLRAADAEPTRIAALYHDPESPVAYRVSWYSRDGARHGDLDLLDTDYLFLVPPGEDEGTGGER